LVIGVCGGIAAYKSAVLVSQLVQHGAGVSVVMTQAARKFIGTATFQALTGRRVVHDTFDLEGYGSGPHIALAEQADLMCIAPATANILAKAATGLADDLLSTLLLSFTGPVVFAPAMNPSMWEKPAVSRNVSTLRAAGYHIVDPEEGWLSCGKRGVGRMAEPETIDAAIRRVLNPRA
jgi:phosphopantothenoylcysteine decarboxylase/phosphopantothenate--cysteine ligase